MVACTSWKQDARAARCAAARCAAARCAAAPLLLRRTLRRRTLRRRTSPLAPPTQQFSRLHPPSPHPHTQVRLVAVSKTKPVEAVQEAYAAGQRAFGENYAQELLDKAPRLPGDIRWHFIGHLQSNKAKALVEGVPNLAMVETLDSAKLADRLDRCVAAAGRAPLAVAVQVNTSGEESKYGVEPGAAVVELARHVHENCPNLRLAGLMTIGMPDYSSRPENFECLARCRADVAAALGLAAADDLELSMGMSGDFEAAVSKKRRGGKGGRSFVGWAFGVALGWGSARTFKTQRSK